jgi:GTP-binding protein HflX
MPQPDGNTDGLKPKERKKLENIFRRRLPPEVIITPELCRYLAALAHEIGRQVAVLIDRQGRITHVIVGTRGDITLPSLQEYRLGHGRLRGLRCIHVHLSSGLIDTEDLTDLGMLRLDLMAAVSTTPSGLPEAIQIAHLKPGTVDTRLPAYEILPPQSPYEAGISFTALVHETEARIVNDFRHKTKAGDRQRAFVISVAAASRAVLEESGTELAELARGAGLEVADIIIQSRRLNPRTVTGSGKLQELTIRAMAEGVELLIFDQDLTPTQAREITAVTDLKVIDRTLLILDIFARRARSREGRLKVELAQQKYRLSWIAEKTTALSRLTGGIGGRGPGETTLEVDRRRIRDRITMLERRLEQLAKSRLTARKRRKKNQLPLVSIVGYTNAGKSTLLNTLTGSTVFTENLPFATLDPTTRRLRLPREREIIITDTVGFIRQLPKDLLDAFRTTLEELQDADLLLHLVDITDERFTERIEVVNNLLTALELDDIPVLLVFNKIDRLPTATVTGLTARFGAIPVSARNAASLEPLLVAIDERLRAGNPAVRQSASACAP